MREEDAALDEVRRIEQDLAAERRVERGHDGAELGDGEPEHDELGAIRQHQADDIALLDAETGERGCRLVRLAVDIGERPLAARHAQKRPAGMLPSRPPKLFRERVGDLATQPPHRPSLPLTTTSS